MALNEWFFWGLAGTVLILFFILVLKRNGKCISRESIKFTNFTDPIFPSPQNYQDNIWPRRGQLGENLFTGWAQYPQAI